MYPSYSKLLLTVFESYFIENDLSGYPEEYWEQIIEEWGSQTGEKGGSDAIFNMANYTNLAVELTKWHTALDTVIMLAAKNCYAPGLCANLSARFKKLTFSRETLKDDITSARSKLKAVETQIKEVADLLPKDGESDIKKTFFDDILQAYETVFSVSPNKETMTVQQFAVRYVKLKERIEQDRRNNADR